MMWGILLWGARVPHSIATPMKITQKNIMSAPDGRYRIDQGLYLVVRNEGRSRSFFLRYSFAGKRIDFSLGSAALKSITSAKSEAIEARALIAQGINPKEKRAKRKESLKTVQTFSEFFYSALPTIERTKRFKNPDTLPSLVGIIKKHALPVFGDKLITEIDVNDVLSVLNPIWETKTRTATFCRAFLEVVFTQARREGVISIPNPAVWRGNLDAWLPSPKKIHIVEHRPAADIQKTKEVIRESLEKRSAPLLALATVILTACRQIEIASLRWSEIDFTNRIISIPPERRKDRRNYDYRIPISDQLLVILNYIPRVGEYVFPSARSQRLPIANSSPQHALACSLRKTKITTHGFRSTFRDWAAENGVDRILAEKSLMHATGNSTELAYQRSDLLDQRRPIIQRWADTLISVNEIEKILKHSDK